VRSRGEREHVPNSCALTINGRLPPETVLRIVRQNFGRFRFCYEEGLARKPTLSGRVAVNFVIDRAGAVSIAKDGGSGACGTTKKGLARLLTNALTEDLSTRDRMPLGIVGAKVKLHRRESQDLELVSVDVPGAKTYDAPVWIAMPDFILAGGDDFVTGVACKPAATSSTRVRDAWRAVIVRDNGGRAGNARID
jgi:hypothetical protein